VLKVGMGVGVVIDVGVGVVVGAGVTEAYLNARVGTLRYYLSW
jgi:hypothetical protein